MECLKEPFFQKLGAALQGGDEGKKDTTSPTELVTKAIGSITVADLKKKRREVAREFPIWGYLAEKVQTSLAAAFIPRLSL